MTLADVLKATITPARPASRTTCRGCRAGWTCCARPPTAQGRRFARVRVVSLPLTDYSRFGVWCAQFTNGAGEDIRYLDRGQAGALKLPGHDYWLFDSRLLLRMHFDDHDAFLGGEVIEDAAEIVQHNYWRDAARHHAIKTGRLALLASLHTLEVQHAEWQRVMRTGLRPRQQALIEWDQRTRLFRAFEATVVPGLLQTAEYARARFAEGIRRLKLPNDINDAVAARVRRQEILYRPDKRFHFVLTEAALRFRLCPPEVMLGQLDRLVSLSQLPNVRLGIIGFETQYATSPWHGFWLYDSERVLIETFSASLDLRQPQRSNCTSAPLSSWRR